jgi:hypothetical protein
LVESARCFAAASSPSFTSAYSSFERRKRSHASRSKNIAYASCCAPPLCATARSPSRLLNHIIALPPRIHRARASLKPLCVRLTTWPLPSARTRPISPGAMPGTSSSKRIQRPSGLSGDVLK